MKKAPPASTASMKGPPASTASMKAPPASPAPVPKSPATSTASAATNVTTRSMSKRKSKTKHVFCTKNKPCIGTSHTQKWLKTNTKGPRDLANGMPKKDMLTLAKKYGCRGYSGLDKLALAGLLLKCGDGKGGRGSNNCAVVRKGATQKKPKGGRVPCKRGRVCDKATAKCRLKKNANKPQTKKKSKKTKSGKIVKKSLTGKGTHTIFA